MYVRVVDFSKVDRTGDEYVDRVVELSGTIPDRFSVKGFDGIHKYHSWFESEIRLVAMSELELIYKITTSTWKRNAIRREAWIRAQKG